MSDPTPRQRLRDAVVEREEERFARLRERRAEAVMRAYREKLPSVEDFEEITGNVESLRRKITFLESVKAAHPATKVAALVTALGGTAGIIELVRQLVLLLRG